MNEKSSDERVRKAEEALVAAERALREIEGEYLPSISNVSAATGVVNGQPVRIISIISEKSART